MPTIIEAAMAGRNKRLGAWIHPSDGAYEPAYKLVNDARRALEGHFQASQMIGSNDRLSIAAKRDDVRRDAADRLKVFGSLQNRLARERAELDRRTAAMKVVVPYRDGDTSTVQIDLALAAHVRSMSPSERMSTLLMGTDSRLVDAVLRLPAQLSGIDAGFRAKVEASAIARQHPEASAEIEALREAHEFAQDILRKAWEELAGVSNTTLEEQVAAAGGAEGAKDLMKKTASSETIDHIAERLTAA